MFYLMFSNWRTIVFFLMFRLSVALSYLSGYMSHAGSLPGVLHATPRIYVTDAQLPPSGGGGVLV